MTREILFRGKTKDGRWMYGDLVRRLVETTWQDILGEYQFAIAGTGEREKTVDFKNKRAEVISCTTVDPATVGQFTGLCDKDGKKIFEGDIIVNDAGIKGIVEYFNELTWDGGCPHPGFYCKEWIEGIATDTDMFYHYNFSKVLVIGNIHDRSKLAKGESE